MEPLFSNLRSITLRLKKGLNSPNPANPDRSMWTLKDLDTPPPGWTDCINNCKGNPAFPQGYQGVEYKNLARVKIQKPKPAEEKVELTNPKDLPTHF